ncbi:MAG TPA: hypothetical protein VFJ06_02205 [Halococcus sp.]|nr:hypothetical protein [Halococcus sp.]
MIDSSSTTRTPGLGTAKWILAAWGVAATMLVFGGSYHSLILIGVGSVVLFGSIVWARRGSQSPVLRPILPVMVGIYLMIGGLYFESAVLQWAGILLVLGYTVWLGWSDIRGFVGRGDRNDD